LGGNPDKKGEATKWIVFRKLYRERLILPSPSTGEGRVGVIMPGSSKVFFAPHPSPLSQGKREFLSGY